MHGKSKNVNIIGATLSLFCLSAMYVFPEAAQKCALKAVIICGKSVIPSLFPYIVATRLFIYFFSESLRKKVENKKEKNTLTFRIALLLGLLSGFPTGAVIAGQMYSEGFMTREEAKKTAIFSSVASPSFCINFFGNEIMNSRLSGFIIYISSVIVNLMMLTVTDTFFKNDNHINNSAECIRSNKKSSVEEILYDSLLTMLCICAYVTFFMCLGEVTYTAISFYFPKIKPLRILFFGISEMTSGTAALKNSDFAQRMLLGAGIIGFGGLSAYMQISSVCSKYGILSKRLFMTRVISAVFVPPVTFILITCYSFLSDLQEDSRALFFILKNVSILILSMTFGYFIIKTVKKYKKSKVNL